LKIHLTEFHQGCGFSKAILVARNAATLVFFGALLYANPFLPLAHGDISLKAEEKSSDSRRKSSIEPTVLMKPVAAEVIRGGEVTIPIGVVSPNGLDIDLQISRPPSCGTLRPLVAQAGTPPRFLYLNDSSAKSPEDSFEFRVRVPGLAWSTHRATIRIKNPPGQLSVIPEKLDFGGVPIGSTSRRTLLLCNSFGAPVSGTLLLPAPWSLAGDGAFFLDENESKSFEIIFTPLEAKSDNTELKVAPELSNFPSVPISGEGVVPFLIDTNSAIVSKEHPNAVFRITNSSGKAMRIGWDDEGGLLCSPPVLIPPGGSSEVWVSIAPLELAAEERKVLHPLLKEGNFSLPLEIIALGPEGRVCLKTTEKKLQAEVGNSIALQGTIESTSAAERTLELKCNEDDREGSESSRKVILPPHSSQPFLINWSSPNSGIKHPKVLLTDSGRIQDVAEWTVSVAPRQSSSQPTPTSLQKVSVTPAAKTLPKGDFYRLDHKDNRCVAAKLTAGQQPGILSNTLVLRWLYLSEGSPEFIIQEKVSRNGLTDRTGEHDENPWRRLSLQSVSENGHWSARMTMPWPGLHTYCVYPSGCQPIPGFINIRVTWFMFLWPLARTIFALLFALCLIKILRERI
jgi:hypothetical protein